MHPLELPHDSASPSHGGGDPTHGMPFSHSAFWNYSWRIFNRHWGPLTVYALCIVGGTVAAQFIPFIGSLAMLYFGPVLTAGVIGVLLDAERRGEQLSIPGMFAIFSSKRSVEVLLVALLVGVCIFIVMLPLFVGVIFLIIGITTTPPPINWMIVTGGLLILIGLVAYGFIYAKLSVAIAVCIDRPAEHPFDVLGPLSSSWELTKGHAGPLCSMWIVFYAIMLLSLIPICLGYLLVSYQLTIAATAASYLLLLPPAKRGGIFNDLSTCPWCGYDLRDTAGPVCSECGKLHPQRSPLPSDEPPMNDMLAEDLLDIPPQNEP